MLRHAFLSVFPATMATFLAIATILVAPIAPVASLAPAASAQTVYEDLREPALRRLGAQIQAGQFAAARDSLAAYLDRYPGDAVMQYNLACLLSLAGDQTAALDRLDTALAAGYRDLQRLYTDPDLAALHDHPRLIALTDSVMTTLVTIMRDAQFSVIEGQWSEDRSLVSSPAPPAGETDSEPSAGRVAVRYDMSGLSLRLTSLPAAAADAVVCVARPRSLEEHETDRWFEFTASLAAPGAVPRTGRHGTHDTMDAAATLTRADAGWRLDIPWSSLRPYRPPLDLLLGLNVTITGAKAPDTPTPRWSLVADPFAGSRTQPWRRFAPAVLDPGLDPAPALVGRLETYLVVADSVTAELTIQGNRGGRATTVLLHGDASGTALAPVDTIVTGLDPDLAFQNVAWNVADLPLGWFTTGARIDGQGAPLQWRDRAFRLPPDWFVTRHARVQAIPPAQRSSVEFHLFRVLRGQQGFQPHDDPTPIAAAAATTEELLSRFENHGTVLPPGAGLFKAAFPSGTDALQACYLVMPDAERRRHAPVTMVLADDSDATGAIAAALATRAATAPDCNYVVLTAASLLAGGGGAVTVIESAREWVTDLLGDASLRLAGAGHAAAPAVAAIRAGSDGWQGLMLLPGTRSTLLDTLQSRAAPDAMAQDLGTVPVLVGLPATAPDRTRVFFAALASAGARITVQPAAADPGDPVAVAAAVIAWDWD